MIFNPFAGPKRNGRRTVEQVVAPMLKAAGIEVDLLATERQGHATELARDANLEKVDALLALGGDGSAKLCAPLESRRPACGGEQLPWRSLPKRRSTQASWSSSSGSPGRPDSRLDQPKPWAAPGEGCGPPPPLSAAGTTRAATTRRADCAGWPLAGLFLGMGCTRLCCPTVRRVRV